ncbi:transcriptional regulator [Helicovermis profundi]|uniref:Uncharacterized protein n=1 Tax=Helicovermis profundi TaxID=3065157 RepID=A0AAU9E5T0_9FIRM|nr:hypothetical protein HLPR_21590 [Clostridia bacterium S502]
MVSLKLISEYVSQTANIIGGVLELDVLIVDNKLRVIGDSNLVSISQNDCIKKSSMLAKVMMDKKSIIFNSKEENIGCLNCNQKDQCVVEMIIGIPVFYANKVLGSVGIIANSPYDKDKMINNKENYLKFIDRMIELIINKITEKQAFEEISLLKKRMEVVFNSIDYFLILVSKDGEIIQTNINFKNIFERKLPRNLKEILDENFVESLLSNREEIKYKEVKIYKKFDFILSSKPVILDQKDQGAILTLRSIKDSAVKMNELYTHSMDVDFEDLVGERSNSKTYS